MAVQRDKGLETGGREKSSGVMNKRICKERQERAAMNVACAIGDVEK